MPAFRSGIFPIKATQEKGLKILTPTKMLQDCQYFLHN